MLNLRVRAQAPAARRALTKPGNEIAILHVLGRPTHINVVDVNFDRFQPIDAMPQFTERRGRLEDFVHFAPSLVRTQEIIIPEETVPDLMARILKLQQPARIERLRADLRNPEGLVEVPRQKFHAQIMSIAA